MSCKEENTERHGKAADGNVWALAFTCHQQNATENTLKSPIG